MQGEIIVGLDVGTSKICVVVGELIDDKLEIIGLGIQPSQGLRKGMVINVDQTVEAIKKALEEAELMAGVDIHSVYTGIAGGHIKGFNSTGVVAIKGDVVTQKDVDRAIGRAKLISIPVNSQILHVLAQEFIVDDARGIMNPIGMAGNRLEVKVHIVTGATTSTQNIKNCCRLAGVDINEIILQPLASSKAVLTPEEKEIGVALIDFGGGTTDLAIFNGKSIKHTSVLPLGGHNLTNDIAIGLRTTHNQAEKIKKKYGCGLRSLIDGDEVVEVKSVGGGKSRTISKKILGEILEPRVEEIFSLIYDDLVRAGFKDLIPAGVVVTGGSSLLPGVIEMAEQVFNLPARRGYPQHVGGLTDVIKDPAYATAVGLVLYGADKQDTEPIRKDLFFSRFFEKLKQWFTQFG